MGIVTVNEENLTNIANAIREKNQTDTTYKPSEMAGAIEEIGFAPRHVSFYYYTGTELDYELSCINFNKMTSCNRLFHSCLKLVSIPLIDTSNIIDFTYMFGSCHDLVSIPNIDTSSGQIFDYMFYFTEDIRIPTLDLRKGTSFNNMFQGSEAIIEGLNTTGVTNFKNMFYEFAGTSIPSIDTSSGENFSNMFYSARKIITIPELDFSKATNVDNVLTWYNTGMAVKNLGGFKNLGKAYDPEAEANYSNYTLSIKQATNLTYESVMNVINNLYDISSKGCQPQSLVLGYNLLNRVSDDEIAIATAKGWTVS